MRTPDILCIGLFAGMAGLAVACGPKEAQSSSLVQPAELCDLDQHGIDECPIVAVDHAGDIILGSPLGSKYENSRLITFKSVHSDREKKALIDKYCHDKPITVFRWEKYYEEPAIHWRWADDVSSRNKDRSNKPDRYDGYFVCQYGFGDPFQIAPVKTGK